MALWLGVTAVVAGYIRHITPLMVIGLVVMMVGIALWWAFRASKQVRAIREQHAERRLNKRLGLSSAHNPTMRHATTRTEQARLDAPAVRADAGGTTEAGAEGQEHDSPEKPERLPKRTATGDANAQNPQGNKL
jgi:outer membrane protein TolC